MRNGLVLSIDVDRITWLRGAAARLGVSFSALAEHLLTIGAKHSSREALLEWAAKAKGDRRRERAAKPSDDLRGSERRTLAALGSEWSTFADLQARTAQSPAILWRALQGLQAKGRADAQPFENAIRDASGRPVASSWRRA